MLGEKYELDVRPTFIEELDAAVSYIERKLRNPQAADELVAKAYAAIDARLFAPEAFQPCYKEPDVRQPYYRIPAGNFEIYYIVHDHVMEVRWFRYGRSERPFTEM